MTVLDMARQDIARRGAVSPDTTGGMIDPFGRRISYLRLSVTDRCDLRCTYCMAERQTFLPRSELLSFEEMDRLASAFIGLGTRRIRLTGGEPLVRSGVIDLVRSLSRHLDSGALDELTLTTNGTLLERYAVDLAGAGVRRINVSIDSLDSDTYRRITRGGDIAKVMRGLDAAQAAGLDIKINTVALKSDNADQLADMIGWAHGRGLEITLIETMPLGLIEADRTHQFLALDTVRRDLEDRWTLTPVLKRTGGPARYVQVEQTGGVLGLITPMTHGFCETCNRVRLTCTGRLYLCLGQDDHVDLRAVMREHDGDGPMITAIREGLARKPERHDFRIATGAAPAVARPMSMTGG